MTSIQWTERTWNPVRGCSRVSPGCDNCYAMGQAHRFSGAGKPYEGLTTIRRGGVDWSGVARFVPEMLDVPLRTRKPTMWFVNSMSDLFHHSVTNEEIAAVFGVMAESPRHTYQVLTKRPARMREWFEWYEGASGAGASPYAASCAAREILGGTLDRYCPDPGPDDWPLPNVWLGVSAEDQQRADERIPHLLAVPAAVRFVSAEPLLGPIDFDRIGNALFNREAMVRAVMQRGLNRDQAEDYIAHPQLDWVIVGGESGPKARACDVAWIRSIVRQCDAADVSCFVKQLGSHPYINGSPGERHSWPCGWTVRGEPPGDPHDSRTWLSLRDRKGGTPSEWPEDLRVRQFPEVRT